MVSGFHCCRFPIYRAIRNCLRDHGRVLRIGAAKTASLPVVAPAIGEALVTTAIGLATAIPAVFFYNWLDHRVGNFMEDLEAAASEWVALIAESSQSYGDPTATRAARGARLARGFGRDRRDCAWRSRAAIDVRRAVFATST